MAYFARGNGRYASGKNAYGHCMRSGKRVPLNQLVVDGDNPGLLVAADWHDPEHPLDRPVAFADPESLRYPTGDLDALTAADADEDSDVTADDSDITVDDTDITVDDDS